MSDLDEQTLIAHYRFQNVVGSMTYSDNDRFPATLISGVTWTSGKNGSGIGFGSPSYIEIDNLNLTNLDKLSIAFWVNPGEWETNDRIIDQQDSGPENGFTFVQAVGTGSVQFVIRSGTTTNTAIVFAVPNGSWSHVVGTIDNTTETANVYLNGSLIDTDTSAYMKPSSVALRIGKRANSTLNPLSGLIDDVRFYNSILNQDEITGIYNETESYGPKNITYVVGDI